jgi:hypothetical protein
MDDPELRGTIDLTSAPEDHVLDVVRLLRVAGAALDAIWREALLTNSGESVLRISEASHGVHRALIALDFDLTEVTNRPPAHRTSGARGS